ncbi:NAD(P)-dependent dehydrogenase [Commensalibacter communis]|uniref:Short-chain alcohol dehydrogenase family (FabG) n=1 Tax=Commensalibacter communis TaxID=2972786 RepID=A0A9W4TKV1_9PROT|nr:SDR family oxidoreductase [Commensalibacter communis]CAI3924202.1 NAD(P)-dependent dehydrogenase [Commensalibacter communis]CAI3928156.1 NAD(P)-dependent dehydrogenase [Commensalibacter communis]CAI3928730.1 NAD(P)-dependent dehydrogenase [Commensalibacter communis]CAI3932732.1 NAD(P)-dependent dehydrogenase [Commensalibacter communis]CAI3934268.1 NAD(P)-dependent dehydrogenase [Commensalibacter communis]
MTANYQDTFKNQYFVVTGGNQGLGACVSNLIAERGAKGIVICGRSVEKGKKQEEQLRKLGCDAHFVEANFLDVESCKHVIDYAEKHFGTLNGLVNCAGMSDRGTIVDTSPELFDKIFAVNIRAPFFLIQHAIKLMIRKKVEGSIVNIITITSHGGESFLAPYAASKGALATLTHNVAYSAMRNRIRVNGLNIGWMDTPHEHEIQKQYHNVSDNWLEEIEKKQPFGRLLKPQEVARAVSFLLSKESGMMTGSVIDFAQGVIGCGDQGAPQPLHPLSLS